MLGEGAAETKGWEKGEFGAPKALGHLRALILSGAGLDLCLLPSAGLGRALLSLNPHQGAQQQHHQKRKKKKKKSRLIKENIKAELFVQQRASDGEIPSMGRGKSEGEGKR